ncbi:unnamed protein product [Rotaria magnacalcarata]|uniref:Uncharacterized protein n=2 Tax=Rotaria magnacalcarata TaxID=392030 RepID=A0A815SS96_9BILA|nr:unnamed protein product [Rotaria magnacalcarata]CAF1646784.1 unnamed protein product [Rotaria magnacalcarata]CAF1951393.1 unnamed protein product [Rotaria magnacalcarata]CAF2056545.1 unnamed protein product [Rotaria magnacalcarata]CAF2217226.1 unnamed protein product [Rotaria magnacalcarata]
MLTLSFILLFCLYLITAGLYIFVVHQSELVIIENPSLAIYETLHEQHSSNILCPCSQISVPYDRFFNVTFLLHQICTSSLVSSARLDYLTLLNTNRLPSWTSSDFARDFHTYGASYFQFVATFCLFARINIEDAQRVFVSTQFINNHLPPQSVLLQQIQSIFESFISQTRHHFTWLVNWIEVATMIDNFLTGENTNAQIIIDSNGQVIINDVTYMVVTKITHNSLSSSGRCSCGIEFDQCLLKPIIYTNGSNRLDFVQLFDELQVGCIPIIGLYRTTFDWWYSAT